MRRASWLPWLPYPLLGLVHVVSLALDAKAVSDATHVLLMPVLALVLLAVPRAERGPAWPWALGALAGSWIGDSLPKVLPEAGNARFMAMVGGFAIAQVMWIRAFSQRVPRGEWRRSAVSGQRAPTPYVAAITVAATALLGPTVPHAGALAPAALIYGILLTATAFVAGRHGWSGMLGGALFVASDGLIALGAFRPELVGNGQRDLAVMVTYFLAQALLVHAVLTRGEARRAG